MDVNEYTPTNYLVGSAFGRLKPYLEQHKYRRGRNKGDAPADHYRRYKRHFRVVDRKSFMVVRTYNTDILTAYPDGRVVLDMGGWFTITTKANLNYALGHFVPFGRVSICSRKLFGRNQLCLDVNGKLYRYYDGIELDADHNISSPLKSFEAKRINRQATKELAAELKASGFKDVFKVLAASVTPDMRTRVYYDAGKLREALADADYADRWLEIIADYAFYKKYIPSRLHEWSKREPKEVWVALMRDLKHPMYESVDSGTTVV